MRINIESVKTMNSVKFSEDKTNELIKGLKESGEIVGLEDLSNYIRRKGVIVKEHIGRKRLVFEMNPKFYGVNLSQKEESLRGFHQNHVKPGSILFIPKSVERELTNLESSIRMMRRRASIGYEDKFMPIDTYYEFKEEFEKRKVKYFEIRDKIVNNWDQLVRGFEIELNSWLDEFNAEDREVLFRTIMSRVPTPQEYKNSFYMELTVKAFPVSENLDMFRDDIREQIEQGLKEETVATMYEIIGNTLSQAFDVTVNAIQNYKKNGSLAGKTKSGIKKASEQIAQKNIFANDVIDAIKSKLLELSRTSSVVIVAEEILGAIYGYAKELGIEEQIDISKCHLNQEDLLMYYEEFKYEQQLDKAIAE